MCAWHVITFGCCKFFTFLFVKLCRGCSFLVSGSWLLHYKDSFQSWLGKYHYFRFVLWCDTPNTPRYHFFYLHVSLVHRSQEDWGVVRSDLALPNHFATRVYRLKWMRINPPLDKLFDEKVRLTLIIYYSHVKILPRLSCADSFLILLHCIPRIDLISVFYARKHCKK